jgi:hypothetical protein
LQGPASRAAEWVDPGELVAVLAILEFEWAAAEAGVSVQALAEALFGRFGRLFAAAVKLPKEQRPAWLARLVEDARELDRHQSN